MRKRFEAATLGRTPISEIKINPKSKSAIDHLLCGLQAIYSTPEYNEAIFAIIEKHLPKVDFKNGRPGMNLWTMFVLAQTRLCNGYSYDELHHIANNDMLLRKMIGIDFVFNEEPYTFEYQNIYDNVSKLTDAMLIEINDVIVKFGQGEVFKKKSTALHLKTDSFVLESNVHFPSDYSLLWDCSRKCIDTVGKFIRKYPLQIEGWRKLKNWKYELKSMARNIGRISKSNSKNKELLLKQATTKYLTKCRLLQSKLETDKKKFPSSTPADLKLHYSLENYITLLIKHIDLVDRRILKGETIPHEEKMMSIFEDYTEWVAKGKTRPSVELGKKISITSDQDGLILHHKVMDNQQDRDIVIEVADCLLSKGYDINSISFDKGHWNAQNKELLELEIENVIMPKLGKLTIKEKEIENSPIFKRLKNKHSAVESNINELEHRGLDRCPDRSYKHFKSYVALGVCAYNLKKIGKKILDDRLKELSLQKAA